MEITKNQIQIKVVESKKMLKLFIDFPVVLYKGNPYFSPVIFEEEVGNLTPAKNPASRYCDFRLFLAYRDNKIVGRICAIINHFSNKKYSQKRIRFNRIDMIDDIEVTKALIGAVADFGRENGLTEIAGPLGYSDQDKEGLLTYGFDQKNMFVTFYTSEYYVHHLKSLGFVADANWEEYRITMPKNFDQKFEKLAEFSSRKLGVHLVKIKNKKTLQPYVRQVLQLMNRAYDHLYGYVPIPEELMDSLAATYVPIINLDFLQLVADKDEKIVAFGLMLPSPVDALKKINGHLYPFGFIRFLRALKTSKTLDMMLVAVEPSLKNSGVMTIIFAEAIKNAIKHGIEYAETGPELETNESVRSLWKSFDRVNHKRRTCFLRSIDL